MARAALPIDVRADAIRIVRWDDPVLDAIGHDPRSAYVERYWLALLGPSTTFLVRRLAEELERSPDGIDLHLEATAHALGLGARLGSTGPFYRALARTGQFHISRPAGPATLAVRSRLQTLTAHQVERLPPALREEHAAWLTQATAPPDAGERATRARRLALSLLELGEGPEEAELQLHRWGVHPALASQAIRWAEGRRTALVAADEPVRRARPHPTALPPPDSAA